MSWSMQYQKKLFQLIQLFLPKILDFIWLYISDNFIILFSYELVV